MGLEDRDWYRAEPSKSWRRRWDSPSGSPPRGGSTGGRGWVRPGAWLAMAVSVVAVVITASLDLFALPFVGAPREAPSAVLNRSPAAAADQSKVVRLGASPGFDVPATRVGTWSVTDPRFGTVSIVVPIGTKPRDAFVIELAERGYQVVG